MSAYGPAGARCGEIMAGMWSRETLTPDGEQPKRPERPPAPPRIDRLTGPAVQRLQATAGNAAVTRLLARTMSEKVQPFATLQDGLVTLPKLRALKGVLDVAVAKVRSDPEQALFVQLSKIDGWLTQYADKLSQLEQEIAKGGAADPDTVGVAYAQIDSGAALNTYFKAVVTRLGNIRGELNRGFDEWQAWKKKEAEKEPEEPGWWEEFGQASDDGGKGEADSGPKAKKAGPVEFPHDGKHQPPPVWFKNGAPIWASFEAGTKDDDSKYKTRDPVTVIGWEDEARENGLTLLDGFTIIYRFTEDVGADKGERTRCVRIDGDHGHPIIETRSGLNTAFDNYVKKEVEAAKGNAARLEEIADFLTRVGLSPGAYKIKLPAKV